MRGAWEPMLGSLQRKQKPFVVGSLDLCGSLALSNMKAAVNISTVVRASGADDDCAALYDEGCNGVLTAAWLFMTKVKLTCLIVVLLIVLSKPLRDFGRVVQFTV